MSETLYVIPWYNCNLDCPHCELHENKPIGNMFKFLQSICFRGLEKGSNDTYVLFGGEPLLFKDKFHHIINTGLIDTVSTNMLLWDNDIEKKIAEYDITIATSYNPLRFTEHRFMTWLRNVASATRAGIDVKVLITLTEDLFDMPMNILINVMHSMECSGVKSFMFEPYVGEKECNDLADQWLIKFHEEYAKHNIKMNSEIVNKLDNWNCDCSNTYTLEPTGVVKKGCPQYKPTEVPKECLTCPTSDVCRPCVLQKTCSYPRNFAEYIKRHKA